MSAITNLDPKPWVFHGSRYASKPTPAVTDPSPTYWAPRPEFGVRGNPLLEIFADLVEHNDGVEPVADLAERFLGEHERYVELSSIPERQYAEEVLERIIVSGNQKES